MNTAEIYKKLKRRCGRTFLGVFARDRLPAALPPRRPLYLVVNTENHNKPGQHWIVLCIDKDGEFFDSYGRPPTNIFRSYLDKFCGKWIFNDTRVQSIVSRFCGHYCIFYCYFKTLGYSMKEVLDCFIDDTAYNDLFVHRFVCSNL
jgi:hypothetical protein